MQLLILVYVALEYLTVLCAHAHSEKMRTLSGQKAEKYHGKLRVCARLDVLALIQQTHSLFYTLVVHLL